MATIRSEEEAAQHILEVMVNQFHTGPGQILMFGSFLKPFNANGWSSADFNAGLEYGIRRGWLELPLPAQVRLTEAGFAAA